MSTRATLHEPLLTARAAAQLLGVGRSTLQRKALLGQIPCRVLWSGERKSTIRFVRAELEQWLADRRQLPPGVMGGGRHG